MEQDIFDSIKLKNFNELNEMERAEIAEFCSNEVEFNEYKAFLLDVEQMNMNALASDEMQPAEGVKSKLDDLFAAQFSTQAQSRTLWSSLYPTEKVIWMRPLVQIAAIFLLFLGMLPLLINKQLENTQTQLAKHEVKVENKNDFKESEEQATDKKLNPAMGNEMNENHSDALRANEEQMEVADRSNIQFDSDESNLQEVSSDYRLKDEISRPISFASKQKPASRASSSDHVDGVFNGFSAQLESNYSVPISKQPELLDLLTAAF